MRLFTRFFMIGVGVLFLQRDSSGAEYRAYGDIIGARGTYQVKADDSLIELARKSDLGYNAIVAANPGVDAILPKRGTVIAIPTSWIIPDVPRRHGIVINISEMRLFYFPRRHADQVVTFPIGIGDEGWETPTGTYRIIEKIVNLAWHVPVSIQKQKSSSPQSSPGTGKPTRNACPQTLHRNGSHTRDRPSFRHRQEGQPWLYPSLPGRHHPTVQADQNRHQGHHHPATGQGND